jgi:hypothetical protein
MEKIKSYTSPFGKAIYPHLSKADVRFKAEGEFKVDLELSDTDAESIISIINDTQEKAVKEAQDKTGKKNIKKASLPFKKENGKTIFKFKMKASGTNAKTGDTFKQRPAIFDNELKPMSPDISIWGGSVLRVNYIPHGYYTPMLGAGVTLRLKSVQVKNLVEGNSQSSNGFEPVEGDSANHNSSNTNDSSQEKMANTYDF